MSIFSKMGLGAAALLLGFAAVAGEHGHSLMVHQPWVKEAPPASKVNAAYMVLENKSDHAKVLTGASSPSFGKVEIHTTEMSGGMAHMKKQDSVEIPAHGRFEMKPGGFHLMLMQPKKPLHAGDKVHLMLNFADGGMMGVDAEVRKAMGGMDHGDHSMEEKKPMPMQHDH